MTGSIISNRPAARGETSEITRIETIPIALPVRREWRWRGLQGDLGRWVIIRAYAKNGLVGLGEATPLPDWGGDFNRYAGETPATVCHVVNDLLAPVVVGTDPFDVESTLVAMDQVVRGHLYAKAAVEIALFDLQGKVTGQPLYRLLGGRFRKGVAIAHMIGIMERTEAVQEAIAAFDDGCRAFQIKGTGEPQRDLEVVAAIREALGSQVDLRFDVNQGYRHLGSKRALQASRDLVKAGIDLLEQPTEGWGEMAELRQGIDIPVIADESAWQPADIIEIARAGAADAISIYIAKAGGVSRARRVAILAEAYGLPADVNGSLESGVGNAANVHFATALPAVSLACVIPVSAPAGMGAARMAGRYYADDVITEPFLFSEGRLFPPEGPGLGVEIDESKLTKYRVDAK